MIGIIVVFPSRENAANIRNLLVRYGMTVSGVCTTGARMRWMKESWSADTS